ncbi:MAG: hypothetical protein O3B27_11575 [Actinomycetota bacterium]|nr:hypothetical protein [Actinomycetota bacterium]
MRYRVYLVLALVAAAGAWLSWSGVRSLVDVPPIIDGQPATVSVAYDPPLMMLAWLLATLAGVLLVLGVAGLRRRRSALATHTP